jgi:hypothetical protein
LIVILLLIAALSFFSEVGRWTLDVKLLRLRFSPPQFATPNA